MKKAKLLLFFSVLLSCLLLVNWHYDFEFTSGTPFNIRALVFNMFFRHQINLDYFWSNAGIDVAYSPDGHLYSGYPPGAALVTLPFFAVEQALAYLHTHLLGPMNGTIAWWLESIFIALPSILALALTSVLLFDLLRRFDVSEKVALVAAWALPFTTFILPYATVIHYHTLAMFWAFVGLWSLLGLQGQALQTQKGRVFLAGLALGMAGLTEYATILYAVPVFLYLVVVAGLVPAFIKGDHEGRNYSIALSFTLGLAIPLAFLAFYNWQSFGAPWKFSHQFMGTMPVNLSNYFTGNGEPHPEATSQLIPKTLVFGLTPWISFFGLYLSPLRGLLFHAPLIILAPFGVAMLWKKHRAEAAVLFGCITVTTLLYSFWKEWWGGAAYGPRFLISALPIWFLFVGFGLDRLWSLRKNLRPLLVVCFLITNSAALTGLRDFVREADTAAPWRLIPLERVQKLFAAVTTFDNSKLSPFIFRFQHELSVLSSLSPCSLLIVYCLLLLAVELLPLVYLLKDDKGLVEDGKGG